MMTVKLHCSLQFEDNNIIVESLKVFCIISQIKKD